MFPVAVEVLRHGKHEYLRLSGSIQEYDGEMRSGTINLT